MNAKPEWTERADKRGLDPLGMQNAGVTLYQSLLPGISNVTLRIRYYGYYCWVSDAYARIGATDEFAAWRSWVRRAEALYALVSSHATGQGGVGGVEWADRRLTLGEDVIDFAEAASNDTNVVRYLRQALGVFGGAYYSQMVEVGLFTQGEHGIQRATNGAGKSAAEAFRASIGADVEQVLTESIASARVSRKDLDTLAPIVPSAIPELSSERDTYEQLLFSQSDDNEGDRSRAASLRLILNAASSLGCRPNPNSIRWHLFLASSLEDEQLGGQRLRWEAYQCQDLMQVAAAALLEWATDLMAELDGGRTLAEIREEVETRLSSSSPEDIGTNWSAFREQIDPDSYDYEKTWNRLTGRRDSAEEKAWDAIRLIAALDQRTRARRALAEVIRRELGVRGNARSITSELAWLSPRSGQTVRDVVSTYITERVIRRHSWVAMQKLRRQRDYTFLFEVRDGRLVRRSGYAPVATTPRLNPAVQFLEDVGLIDDQGPTARGRAILGANA